jgi:hypothetical protein
MDFTLAGAASSRELEKDSRSTGLPRMSATSVLGSPIYEPASESVCFSARAGFCYRVDLTDD